MDTEGGGGDIATLEDDNTEDVEDDDNKDDDKEDKEDDKEDLEDDDKESEDENDEEDEDKEDDDEEEEEEDDEEDDDEVLSSDIKAIKSKYPTLLKEFPGVRAALYRDQQYSEFFGSPKDAEVIVKKAGVLDKVEEDIFVNHDPSNLLESLSKDKDALENVSFELMRWTMKNNKDLYLELAALPLKQVLRNAWKEGNGNKTDLGRAAAYIHKFFFNDTDISSKVKIEDGKSRSDDKNPAKEAYEKRLSQLEQREYENFKGAVDQSYIRKMSGYIQDSLDKDERLNDWMKGRIVKETIEEIGSQLENDSRYMNQIGSIWKQAKTAGFPNDFKSRIVSTALARAKSLVPEIRKRLVSEALGKKLKRQEEDSNKVRKFKKVVRTEGKREDRKESKIQNDMDILRGA